MTDHYFGYADPVFFDDLSRLDDSATRFAQADLPAPEGWSRHDGGVWVQLMPDGVRLPEQGWKIHVAGRAEDSAKLVAMVHEHCVAAQVAFKFLRSSRVADICNSKAAVRGSGGKLITIYPADERSLESLLTDLGARLDGIASPYVLGDLRWREGPLYLRYGGFARRWCRDVDGTWCLAVADADGRLVPDARGAVFEVPPGAPTPDFISAQLTADESGEQLPYEIDGALHFTNAGGIYTATDPATGARVVVREARPYAGLDDHGRDAVTRMDHEYALRRSLGDLDVLPRLIDRFRCWEHEFLVEEFVEGAQLHAEIVRRHPLIWPDPSPAELAEYRDWALSTIERVATAVGRLHERGVVFGDLQPHNVLVRPDGRIVLVDLEVADHADSGRAPGLGTAGYTARWARTGVAVDRYALDCLRLAIFYPVTPLLYLDQHQADRLGELIDDRFGPPPGYTAAAREGVRPPATLRRPAAEIDAPWPRLLDRLRDSIVESATPDRLDRLFPGDPRQFDGQGASLAYGAAGVLYALHSSWRHDYPDFGAHVDWLIRYTARQPWLRPGLYDGLYGIAYVLDRLGRREAAVEVIHRARSVVDECPSAGLFDGLAGIGLAQLDLASRLDDVALFDAATDAARRLALALDDPAAAQVAEVHRAGLLHGWSGAALLMLRLHDHTGDPGLLVSAGRALRRDLDRCIGGRGGGLGVSDEAGRYVCYLETGSAGIGIALTEYLRRADDPELAGAAAAIRRALGLELVLWPGLFEGRAGLLSALAHHRDPGDAGATHLHHLKGLLVPYHAHLAVPGNGLYRLSMDLATGAAGVLLSVDSQLRSGSCRLPGVDGPDSGSPIDLTTTRR